MYEETANITNLSASGHNQ